MVLKAGDDMDRLRGHLALEESLRLAFLEPKKNSVLVVSKRDEELAIEDTEAFTFESMTSAEFERKLAEDPSSLEGYLKRGEDLLGRRDDIIWRRIESSGFDVKKGRGVP